MKRSSDPDRRAGRRVAALLAGAAPLVAGALLWGLAAAPAAAQPEASGGYELDVASGKSQVLETPGSYTDLMIGDAAVADVVPLSTHSVYVVGKHVGSTSLSIYGRGKRLIAAVNVVVGPDLATLQSRLHETLPNEHDISLTSANGALVMSGTVSNPVALHQALTLADTFDPGKVVNMLGVEGTQQVQLQVRFAEMDRSVAKGLSIGIQRQTLTGSPTNPQFNFSNGTLTGGAVPGITGQAASLGLSFLTGDANMNIELDALENRGLSRTLAEPTLVAMSGETASFLAGGEIPIPSVQTGAGTTANGGIGIITVQYQQFGVSLSFTPTILADGLINLVVKPEVSSIDNADAITINGVTIPQLKVSRASTTVELRDGESFVIAGLLSDDYTNQVSGIPYLSDIPVLGALFRSPSFQSKQTELVVVVTPHLAVARRGPVDLPTNHFTPPSDYELFLFGMLSGQGAAMNPADRALLSRDPTKGGVEGPYGHVLY